MIHIKDHSQVIFLIRMSHGGQKSVFDESMASNGQTSNAKSKTKFE
jgi:hypothetical protein